MRRVRPAGVPRFACAVALVALVAVLGGRTHAGDDAVRTVAPGDVVTLAVPFGPFPKDRDAIPLDVRPPDGWTLVDAPRHATFVADAPRALLVTVVVPSTAPAGRATLTATLAEGRDDVATVHVPLAVRAEPRATWTAVGPPTLEDAGGVTAPLELRNDGNVDLTLTLEAEPTGRVVPEHVDLAPGARARVEVRVSVPRRSGGDGADRVRVTARSERKVLARHVVSMPAGASPPSPAPARPRFAGTVELRTGVGSGVSDALALTGRTRDRAPGRATLALDATLRPDAAPDLDLRLTHGAVRLDVGREARAAVPGRPRIEGFGVAVELDRFDVAGVAATLEGFVAISDPDPNAPPSPEGAGAPSLQGGARLALDPAAGWDVDVALGGSRAAMAGSVGGEVTRPLGDSGGVASVRARVGLHADAASPLGVSGSFTARWRDAHRAFAWAFDGATGGAAGSAAPEGEAGGFRAVAATASWWPEAAPVASLVAHATSRRGHDPGDASGAGVDRDDLTVRVTTAPAPWRVDVRAHVARVGVGAAAGPAREASLTVAAEGGDGAGPWRARAEVGLHLRPGVEGDRLAAGGAIPAPSLRVVGEADLGVGTASASVRRWRPDGGTAAPELHAEVAWDASVGDGVAARVAAYREGPVGPGAVRGLDVALEATRAGPGVASVTAERWASDRGAGGTLALRWAGSVGAGVGLPALDVDAALHLDAGGAGRRVHAELAVGRAFAVPLAPPPPTGEVMGTLRGPDGPWAGAEVRVGGRIVTTDADGVFRARGLPLGEVYVARGAVGWPFDVRFDPPPPHRVTVRAGATTRVAYDVVRTGTLTGSVEVVATGDAQFVDAPRFDVGSVAVVLTRAGERRVVRPGPDGRWRRTQVLPGRWRVEVVLGEGAARVQAVRAPEVVHLAPGGGADLPVRLVLQPRTVRTRDGGRLTVPEGAP